jgi:TPR repeat protein
MELSRTTTTQRFNPLIVSNRTVTSHLKEMQASYAADPVTFFQTAIAADVNSVKTTLSILHNSLIHPSFLAESETDIPQEFKFLFESPESRKEAYKTLHFVLGELHEEGRSVKQSDEQAAFHYRQAAEHGCVLSADSLLQMYLNGKGLIHNSAHAIKILARESKNGNSFATYQLAKLYAQLERHSEAVQCFRQTAETSDFFTGNELIDLHLYIQEHADNKQSLLATCKNPGILHRLGNVYLQGNAAKGISPDLETAKNYFRAAAKLGHSYAAYQLAEILLKSDDKNMFIGQEVITLLTQAAGLPGACCILGKLYLNGDVSLQIESNQQLAEKYLLMAAEQGHGESIHLIATRCPLQVAEVASPKLLYVLGVALVNGDTPVGRVTQNIDFGKYFLQKAADQGEIRACAALAQLLLKIGDKNPRDGQGLLNLLVRAADGGIRYATIQLGNLLLNGDDAWGIQKNEQLAVKYLLMAAEKGHTESSIVIGKLWLAQCEQRFEAFKQNSGYKFDLITFVYGPGRQAYPSLCHLFDNVKQRFMHNHANNENTLYQLAMLHPPTHPDHLLYLKWADSKNQPDAAYQLGLLSLANGRQLEAFYHFKGALRCSENKHQQAAASLWQILKSEIPFFPSAEKNRKVAEANDACLLAANLGDSDAQIYAKKELGWSPMVNKN